MKTSPETEALKKRYRNHLYMPPGVDEQATLNSAAKRLKDGVVSLVHKHKYGQACDGFYHIVFDEEPEDDANRVTGASD